MKAGDTLYLPYPDTVEIVTFIEDGDDGCNFKRRKLDPVVVLENGERHIVERAALYYDPLAAAITSAEMARKIEADE